MTSIDAALENEAWDLDASFDCGEAYAENAADRVIYRLSDDEPR